MPDKAEIEVEPGQVTVEQLVDAVKYAGFTAAVRQ
jgi:copper chaperone CopZ